MNYLLPISFLILIFCLLSGCGLKKLLPEGPVFNEKQRDKYLTPSLRSIHYRGEARTNTPIIPIQIWAAAYDLDIVLVSKNKTWNMHEYARLQGPDGPIWIMKDALESTLEQSIIADIPDIQNWLPELPVDRKYYPVKVTDHSNSKWLDLQFSYENSIGELVEASYQGKVPKTKQPKRNGSTMGHSKTQLIAVLDLPLRDFGKKASISFNGKPAKIKKILGLMPFQMALVQTQAGLSIGAYQLSFDENNNNLKSTHLTGAVVEQQWKFEETSESLTIVQENAFRRLCYQFLKKGEQLELSAAYVELAQQKQEAFRISFVPALPDFRYAFEGTVTSNFVMDVNGQKSHAIGIAKATSTVTGALLDIIPSKPWWVADRPLQTEIKIDPKGTTTVSIKRKST